MSHLQIEPLKKLPAKYRQPRCISCNRPNASWYLHGLCIYSADDRVAFAKKRGCFFKLGRWAETVQPATKPRGFRTGIEWKVLLDRWLELGKPS